MNSDNTRSTFSVLMVCLGNICRSPMAEAALRQLAEREGVKLVIDSAGTGDWHVDSAPDPRARAVASVLGGVEIGNLRARQVQVEDFHRFDHILAMDGANLRHLQAMKPVKYSAQLSLLLDYYQGREGQSVADPYYGDETAFEECWRQIHAACAAFLRQFQQANPPRAS